MPTPTKTETQPYTWSQQGGYTYGAPTSTPTPPPSEPAVISSESVDEDIAKGSTKLTELSNKGTTVGPDGSAYYADNSMVPAPEGAIYNDKTSQYEYGGKKYGVADFYGQNGGTPDDDYTAIQKIFDPLKSTLDANTLTQVNSIQQQFESLKAQQKEANQRAETARSRSLLLGGASRYAPLSASGTMLAQTKYGLEQIQDLDAKENMAIAQAKSAQADGNMKLMMQALDMAETTRKEKQAHAAKVMESIQTANDKMRETRKQASRDDAISGLVQQGVTDPTQILNALNRYDDGTPTGGNFTLKEVSDTMKNIMPSGLSDILKTAAQNGATKDVLAKISAATDMTTAYNAAAGFLQSPSQEFGSGIIGEYQFYVKQARAAGQTPVDFNTYQNQDANRKARASGTGGDKVLSVSEAAALGVPYGTKASEAYGKNPGADTTDGLAQQLVRGDLAPGELSKRTTGTSNYNAVLKAADDYSMKMTGKHFNIAQADRDYKFAQRPQTQDTLNYLGSLVGSVDGKGGTSGGNLDELVTLSESIGRTRFPKLNDAAAWSRMAAGDVKIAQFQAVATEVADQVAKILQGGGGSGTSDAKLQQAANLFNTSFSADQMKGVVESLKPLLANRAKSMVKDNPYLSDYADQFGIKQNRVSSTGLQLVQDETDAKGSVITAVKADPKIAPTVRELVGGTFSGIDHPLTYTEVLQYLQATGSVK